MCAWGVIGHRINDAQWYYGSTQWQSVLWVYMVFCWLRYRSSFLIYMGINFIYFFSSKYYTPNRFCVLLFWAVCKHPNGHSCSSVIYITTDTWQIWDQSLLVIHRFGWVLFWLGFVLVVCFLGGFLVGCLFWFGGFCWCYWVVLFFFNTCRLSSCKVRLDQLYLP